MVGIISAMPEEIQALLLTLKNKTTKIKGMREYHIGMLYDTEVVLVFSRWGKVASAATTTQLINDFDLSEIIFTGVAGGMEDSINIGDIVIGQNLFQYDMDARPFYKQFEVPILRKLHFSTRENEQLIHAAKIFISQYNRFIDIKEAKQFEIEVPQIIQGDIASGDQFVSSIDKIRKLKKNLPTVVCVEMEGASVAQVCFEYDIPFSIIRIISDNANDNANIDFSRFSNTIASNYALGILKNYFA